MIRPFPFLCALLLIVLAVLPLAGTAQGAGGQPTLFVGNSPPPDESTHSPCRPSTLLRLNVQDSAATIDVVRQIEKKGGCVLHVFPPNYLIGEISPYIEQILRQQNRLSESISENRRLSLPLDTPAWLKQVWLQTLLAYEDPDTAYPPGTTGSPLINDTRTPPLSLHQAQSAAAGYSQTSEFMAGRIAVGIILPESNGALDVSTENWTTNQINSVIAEIQNGMTWWAARNPNGNLSFVYDIHSLVPTSYEPINRSSDDDALWINESFSYLGISGSNWVQRAYNYLNAIRQQYQTDWAVVAFVVNSLADADGKFTDGYFGYTYVSPGLIVMTYDNDGWGISGMDGVMAHEFAHDFGAADEYCSPGYSCCWGGGAYGYLGIPNANCEAGCDNNHNGVCDGNDSTPNSSCHNCPSCVQVSCLMRNGSLSAGLDTPTREQVGIRDSDGDSILDPMDTTPTLSINTVPSSPFLGTTAVYRGSVQDIPWNSPTRTDISINYIVKVEAKLDENNTWIQAVSEDGAFDETVESFSLTIPALSAGSHRVEIRAQNRSGIYSTSYIHTFNSGAQPQLTPRLFLPLIFNDNSLLTYIFTP